MKRTIPFEVTQRLWNEYLAPERMSAAECIRRAQRFAADHRLPVPTYGQLERKITDLRRECPDVVTYFRLGRMPAS